MSDQTDPPTVEHLITGVNASRLDARGLAAAKRISGERKTTCLRCTSRPPVGGDQWWAPWCAECLREWVPHHLLPAPDGKPQFTAVPDLPAEGRCVKCGQAEPLGNDAGRSENPAWCGSCNFERTDRRRRRRREPDP